MESTDELMALRGQWLPIAEAVALLTALRADVVAELDEVIAFARAAPAAAKKFNFSVVM